MNKEVVIAASISAVIFGAAGFFVGVKVTGKKFKKEMDIIYGETSKELSEMKRELDELHRIFVETGDIETQSEREELWKSISRDLKLGRKAKAEENNKSSDIIEHDDTSSLSFRRSEEEREDYRAIRSGYVTDSEIDALDPTRGIVRTTADNGIFEISDEEAREGKEFPVEDLYYNEMTTDVYTDNESLIDPVDIPLYLGYNQEELAVRFLHEDEPSYIYIRNPEHQRIYCVYVTQQEH